MTVPYISLGSVGHGAGSYDEWVMVSADGVNGMLKCRYKYFLSYR